MCQALGGWSSPPGSWQCASLHTSPPFHVTFIPNSSHLDTLPSICSEAAPPICLQAYHPLSKANLKSTSPRRPLWVAPCSRPSLIACADYTGCLGSFPKFFIDNSNNSFCLLSAYYIPGAVLKAIILVNTHNASVTEVRKWKFREAKSLVQGHKFGVGYLSPV